MTNRLLTLVLFLVSSTVAFSQSTGKIAGVATDKLTGDQLPGVNVSVVGTTLGASTDVDGFYVILNVPVGQVDVKYSFVGYKDLMMNGVRITVDQTTEMDVQLEESVETGDVVVVQATRELINKENTNRSIVTIAEDIENLPVSNIQEIVAMTSGAVGDSRNTNLNVRGGRANETAIIIDGIAQNDPRDGVVRTDVGQDDIEEVKTQTGGFSAEYGGIMSGLVQISTKSGGSSYKGSMSLQTDDFYGNIADVPSFGHTTFSANVGGPLGVDELRFFASYLYDGKDDYLPFAANSYDGGRKDNLDRLSQTVRGKLTYTGLKDIKFDLSGFATFRDERSIVLNGDVNEAGSSYQKYNSEHNWKSERFTGQLALKMTHSLSRDTYYTFKGGSFVTKRKTGDGKWFDNLRMYGNSLANPVYNDGVHANYGTTLDADGHEVPTNGIAPKSSRVEGESYHVARGAIINRFSKSVSNSLEFTLDFETKAVKNHGIKAGVSWKQYALRNYTLNPRFLARDASVLNTQADAGTGQVANFDAEVERHWKANASYYGYDIFGNEVDGDSYSNFMSDLKDRTSSSYFNPNSTFDDPAREPIVVAAYVNDVWDLNDFVLNIGFRYDYFNANSWQWKDVSKPFGTDFDPNATDDLLTELDEGDIEDSTPYSYLSPRLGVSFPVDEMTNFRAQYGVFYQFPNLQDVYTSLLFFSRNLSGDYSFFSTYSNPNLKPPKTTSYEVGMDHALDDKSVLSATIYYKETQDLVSQRAINIYSEFQTLQNTYGSFANEDNGIVKGVELSYNLRRTNNFQLNVNYNLAYARGTGSNPNTFRSLVHSSLEVPIYQSWLGFDQRHTLNVNADYRYTDNAPIEALNNFGANLIATYRSGTPYTAVAPYESVEGDKPTPIGNLNGARLPDVFNVNLRLMKSFDINPADLKLNAQVYLQVNNLLNKENVRQVYQASGRPDDNGWLSDYDGSSQIVDKGSYNDVLTSSPLNYDPPRMIFLGFKLNF